MFCGILDLYEYFGGKEEFGEGIEITFFCIRYFFRFEYEVCYVVYLINLRGMIIKLVREIWEILDES